METQMRILHELVPVIDALPEDEWRGVWIAIAELMMGIADVSRHKKAHGLLCLQVCDKVLCLRKYRGRGILDIVQYGDGETLGRPQDNYEQREYDELTADNIKERLGPLGIWKTPIDKDQQTLAEMDAEGPVSVTGDAGTGKSTVAIHRVRWLLQKGFPKGGRILLTSYSNTLVHELQRLLYGLFLGDEITWDEYCRVDFKTLDRIAIDACDGLEKKIVYENDEQDLLEKWLNAAYRKNNVITLGGPSDLFKLSFFKDVVLDYRLDSRWDYEEYLRTDRDGMKERKRRQELWPLFEVMLEKVRTSKEIVRSYGFRLAETAYERDPSPYCSIVVDEAQDAGMPELRMLAKMTDNSLAYPKRNSLFLIGDGFQRIYGREAVLRECGINVGAHGGGRYRHLKKNYRSTKQIREFALPFIQNVLARNLDGEAQSARDGVSVAEGEPPLIEFFGSYSEMNERIEELVKEWQLADGEKALLGSYAVLMRETKVFADAQVNGLKDAYLDAEFVGWNSPPADENAVKVMSMHRAKGLQFNGVVVVVDHWPYRVDNPIDYTKEELKRKSDSELCLMYTAMMRAQRHLFITGTMPASQKVFEQCRKAATAKKKNSYTVMWQPTLFPPTSGKVKLSCQQGKR